MQVILYLEAKEAKEAKEAVEVIKAIDVIMFDEVIEATEVFITS